MIYNNINHANSKMDSLKRIIEEESPSVVVLVETKLGEEEEMDIEGYEPFPMNRDENGGGIMISVKLIIMKIMMIYDDTQLPTIAMHCSAPSCV